MKLPGVSCTVNACVSPRGYVALNVCDEKESYAIPWKMEAHVQIQEFGWD